MELFRANRPDGAAPSTRDFVEMGTRLERTLTPVFKKEIVDSRLISGVTLSPFVENVVDHRLARELRGWIAVKRDVPAFEFHATMSANQSINNTTVTKLNFDTETYDYGSNFSPSTYQATIPRTGTYRFDGMAKWQAALGGLSAQITNYKNNTTVLSTNVIAQNDPASDPVQETHFEGHLTKNDVVGLWCSQNTGAAHNILAMATGFFRGSLVDRLFDLQVSNATPDKTLVLRASVEQTVDLLVF
jgi:hypothetical protein